MQAVTVRAFSLEGDDGLYETSTDEAGGFGLDLPMGEYLLRISASAFSTVEQHITLTDRFEPLTVTMRLDAVTEVVDVAADPAEALRLNSIVSLTAQTFVEWCDERRIALHYIQPGKPDQNAFIERFNRSYRTEVLDAYLFESLAEVRALTERWLVSYNQERPHESLGRVPPLMFLPRSNRPEQSPFQVST